MKRSLLAIIVFLALSHPVRAIISSDTTWVDSVFRSLTFEQRIAQLMIVRAWSCKDSTYEDSLTTVLSKYNAGGVCFFKGTPYRQAKLTNRLQSALQTPLLISIDAEWGLGMRLDSAFSFPRQMTLGAITDDSLIYLMGRTVARDCQRMGIQINYAPVVDINNNPLNPVIGFRSFGEEKKAVAKKGMLYMKGLQDGGIVATAKHFPGHGDTDSDSHLTLPIINHTAARMDSVELYPFRALIRAGVKGVMIGHLYVPCYDTAKNTATTLSKNVVTGLLKDQLGFTGYVITDALDMQGVTKYYHPGEIEVKALQAGNDILLLPKHIDKAIAGIKTAVDSGVLSKEMIDQKCLRILKLKYESGLNRQRPVDLSNLTRDLNPVSSEILRKTMVDESITLVKNNINIVPVTGFDRRRIAVVSLGDTSSTVFQEVTRKYCHTDWFNLPRKFQPGRADSLVRSLSGYDIVVIGLHAISSSADSFGLSRQTLHLVDTLTKVNRTILAVFGTPYSLSLIPGLGKAQSILVAYQDNENTQASAAEVIFGGLPAGGKLPVSAASFVRGTGEETEKSRFSFILPEEIGIPRAALHKIDSIALQGIDARAYPGCQVLFSKDGKIFYSKAFGHPRYEDTTMVTTSSIFDLASVTKVAATTLAMMKLADDNKLTLDATLGDYLPELKGSNKASLTIRDVMTHQAGLQAWIPFYRKTLKNGNPDPAIYQPAQSPAYPVRVAEFLYLRKDYADSLWNYIITSPLLPERDYKYSDLGFYILRKMVEVQSQTPFGKYLDVNFYKPLGLQTMGFNPRERFDLQQLMPTEYDTVFRKQLIRGDVHDPGAAMSGGVSGHAGLFSDAADLAVVFQMLLQNGEYGGKRYLSEKIIKEFTRRQFPLQGNRRGLGFDKPLANYSDDGPACQGASKESFGHSGFTGTYVWADPANNLLFVFLSNRVCPDASNRKLSEMNIRTKLHQAMYDLLQKYQAN